MSVVIALTAFFRTGVRTLEQTALERLGLATGNPMWVMSMAKPLLSVLIAVLLLQPLAGRADVERGRLLYENHCLSCHESNVHIRETQAARSLAAVRAAIERWQAVGHLGWGAEEVGDVAAYLNATWYHYTD